MMTWHCEGRVSRKPNPFMSLKLQQYYMWFVVFVLLFQSCIASSNLLISCPVSALQGVHGGGWDVPGGRDQGDQSNQGPQAAPHAPVARIENRQPPPFPPAHLSAALAPKPTYPSFLSLWKGPPIISLPLQCRLHSFTELQEGEGYF